MKIFLKPAVLAALVIMLNSCAFIMNLGGFTDTEAVWSQNASAYRDQNGHQVTYTVGACPSGFSDSVWGTDIYTDDSSVCFAAVHAGAITLSGGTFTIEIRPGQNDYTGSTRNGITSLSYGSWSGSFIVIPNAQ